MLESFRRRALLLKLEGTEGVDAVPTPALNAFEIFDGRSGTTADIIERNRDRPHFTHDPFTVANPRAFVEGSIEIVPPALPGTDAAAVDALLQIAGMARTLIAADAGPPSVPARTRYNPVSTGIPAATAYWYQAKIFRKVLGARANLTGLTLEVGNYLRAQMRIEGTYDDIAEGDLPSGLDYSSFATPRVCSADSLELRVNGIAVEGKSYSLDFGNELKSVEHSEGRVNRINGRRPTFTLRCYRTALATLDPWALWKAGTIIPLLGIHEETDGRATWLSGRGQIESVEEVDIDGDYGWELRGRAIATDAGGDEFGLEFRNTP